MADKPKIVTNGPANFVTKEGNAYGFVVCQTGDPVPDNLAEGQLEHKAKAGAFGPPEEQDWATLNSVGIALAPGGLTGAAPAAPAPPMPEAPVPATVATPGA